MGIQRFPPSPSNLRGCVTNLLQVGDGSAGGSPGEDSENEVLAERAARIQPCTQQAPAGLRCASK